MFDNKKYKMYESALLIRCYTQHVLRPVINFEINHKIHFIKLLPINKGIDFIDLPNTYQEKSVTSPIPDNFENSELPIICYKYNTQIRDIIFNFNNLVSDLDTHVNTPSHKSVSSGF